MRQMLLDLGPVKPPALETFVTGQNEELAQLLRRIGNREASGLGERFAYIWGEPGAGKTHLLQALAATPASRYLDPASSPTAYAYSADVTLYLLDDCDRLSAQAQIAAFALYNQVREHGAWLVAGGAVAPAGLEVREDLRTRLGWGLIYQVHGLTDGEKIAALTRAAEARGMALSAGVLPYLITHFRRDMTSLSAMLDALDRYSLETKRPITLPLLRDLLQLGDEPKAP